MVKVVVVINTLISMILLYVAWRVWRLRLRLIKITNWLNVTEHCSHAILYTAPERICISQQNIHKLRQTNQALEIQIQQLQQILGLLVVGVRFWRRYFQKPRLKI
ncbi:MAG: hypothetical protein N2235_15465 [Fischerella sp.]|nr:hypothetical protein [Fischerella sp.]